MVRFCSGDEQEGRVLLLFLRRVRRTELLRLSDMVQSPTGVREVRLLSSILLDHLCLIISIQLILIRHQYEMMGVERLNPRSAKLTTQFSISLM